jgi:hypothetical protein
MTLQGKLQAEPSAVDEVEAEASAIIGYHDGNAAAAVVTLLIERDDLLERLAIARIVMGEGYTRGWKP